MENELELPTNYEQTILDRLCSRIDTVTGCFETPPLHLAKSIVSICSSFFIPTIFPDHDPKQLSHALKELIRKGFIKEFSDDGLTSFVPISRTKIVEYKYRNFTQEDVN